MTQWQVPLLRINQENLHRCYDDDGDNDGDNDGDGDYYGSDGCDDGDGDEKGETWQEGTDETEEKRRQERGLISTGVNVIPEICNMLLKKREGGEEELQWL